MTEEFGKETTQPKYSFVILLVISGIALSMVPFLLLK